MASLNSGKLQGSVPIQRGTRTSNTLRKGMTEKDQEKWVSTALANDTVKSLGHENDFNTIRHSILLITT